MTFTEAVQFAIRESTRFVSPPAVAAEWVLAGLAIALARTVPLTWLRPVRNAFVNLANRRRVAIAICGALPVVLRLALLPWIPAPDPSIHDEFSHLLLADTLAHGRLSNPTHPMWRHFETIHVIQKPTYSSMYPPTQDSFLAFGEVVFHQPWAGVVISVGIMCAAICWMMQGWLPPAWALYGTLLVILKIGVHGLWMNSFMGAPASTIAGALLFGCLPRLQKWRGSVWLAALFGLSLVLLMNTRPFEGGLLAAATLLYVGRTFWREPRRALMPAALVLACGVLFTGFYNWRVTGSPAHMAYQVNRDTYGWPENLAFLPEKKPVVQNDVMRSMYIKEVKHRSIYSSSEVLIDNLITRLFDNWTFLIGPLLTIPLLYLSRVFRDKETRPLILLVALILFLNLFQMVLYPFHLGPVIAAMFTIIAACVMHRSRQSSIRFAAVLPLCLILIGAMKWEALPLNLPLAYWEIAAEPHRDERAYIQDWLSRRSGKQLVIVHYEPWHDPDHEWVYNGADIDGSKVVWARDLGPDQNRELIKYFEGREVWRLNADLRPARVMAYREGK
jgi:hypothetical protein